MKFRQYEKRIDVEEALEYHVLNDIPIAQNIFRPHTDKYYEFFRYAREIKEQLHEIDHFDYMLLESDIGTFGFYEGEKVPLDHPLIEAEYNDQEVELGEPKRGGDKKYYVYVKNDKGNVIKIQFGDTTGLTAKINDPEARKSFVARHKCDQKKDKTKAGYWACRLPMYAKQLGLKGGGNFFW